METAGNVGNNGIRARCAVIRLETEEEVSTRQEQTDDKVLKSLSPLINSMRLFGLYFTRHPHPAAESSRWRSLRRCKYWNASRIYATVMLVVAWLNISLYSIIINGKETLGLKLLMKIGLISYVLFLGIQSTTYYVASHTGSLDRVFRQVTLSSAEIHPKYSRRAMVLTLVCWTVLVLDIILYIYMIFNPSPFKQETMLSYHIKSLISKHLAYVTSAVYVVIELQLLVCYLFPQAMNYIVMSLLHDQFRKLNEEFGKCIGGRGRFGGNFEQFRQRHQDICRSVKEADRFLMISNVGCFCCNSVCIILVLFSAIFHRHDTVSRGVADAFMFVYWLLLNLFSISLAVGLAIIVNNKVTI